jgi:hypothetical protein
VEHLGTGNERSGKCGEFADESELDPQVHCTGLPRPLPPVQQRPYPRQIREKVAALTAA